MKRPKIKYDPKVTDYIKRFLETDIDLKLLIDAHVEFLLEEVG
ncbi:hypothetical protein [uncultured Sphaerochaeta sp.]|nr:hypothetical protein [uncultured Sphaerochaeta sp.]